MKIVTLLLLTLVSVPSFGMLRPTPAAHAMHRPRHARPVPARRQVTIYNTAYGIIEMLRLKESTQKDPSTLALPETKSKLSPDHDMQEKHVRIKRKPNTISQKREIYINGKEFVAYSTNK